MDILELLGSEKDSETKPDQTDTQSTQRLVNQVERLSLICQSLYECLIEAGVHTSVITEKLTELNGKQGNPNESVTSYLAECHSCGSLVASRHSYCTSCGVRLTKSFIL